MIERITEEEIQAFRISERKRFKRIRNINNMLFVIGMLVGAFVIGVFFYYLGFLKSIISLSIIFIVYLFTIKTFYAYRNKKQHTRT